MPTSSGALARSSDLTECSGRRSGTRGSADSCLHATRSGWKPLYYWDDGSAVVFASELRSLFCHPNVRRTVDVRGLYEYMTLTFVPSPRTAFEGIGRLPPGQRACLRSGRNTVGAVPPIKARIVG